MSALDWSSIPGALPFLLQGMGLSLGLLGSGGSIVTLPVLVYVAGIPAHQAVGMSLVIVGGAPLNDGFARQYGADAYCADAATAAAAARAWVQQRERR